MRTIAFGLLLLISSLATADVLEVNIYKSMPGKGQTTIQYGQEAKAIQEKLGGSVILGAALDGRMHYAMRFDNWAAWSEFGAKLHGSEEWTAFIAKISKNPSADLEENYLLNSAGPLATGGVYQVFIWEPELGRGGDLFQNAAKAEAIHEKTGADVSILSDQLNNLHYVMFFENWDAWAKFQDTPNAEFQAFMQEASQNPAAKLVKVYTATSL